MGPSRIGRYEICGELATGGMAEVLLGRVVGPNGFERAVVVKRILRHLAKQESFVRMFLDEARLIARIHHPNVVQVHDLGSDGDDFFLAMEYLDGESVSGLMRRLVFRNQPLDPPLGAYIAAEAAAGLHAAHELVNDSGEKLGIVHRDISPQNIFITYDGHVKVLDFGIAKASDQTARTRTGQVKGKYEYMSPEQCSGKPVDRRSDVFSLGVVLWELITSRRLFKRDTPMQVFRAICDRPALPPSRVSPACSSELDAVCLNALTIDREQRFPTALDFRKALLPLTLDPGRYADPGDALATLMREIFADRIAAKHDTLRAMRTQTAVDIVPPEADQGTEIPAAWERDEQIAAAATRFEGGPSRAAGFFSRRGVKSVAALIGLAALTAIALFMRSTVYDRIEPMRTFRALPSVPVIAVSPPETAPVPAATTTTPAAPERRGGRPTPNTKSAAAPPSAARPPDPWSKWQ